jgi:hypothetical protein
MDALNEEEFDLKRQVLAGCFGLTEGGMGRFFPSSADISRKKRQNVGWRVQHVTDCFCARMSGPVTSMLS